jgi:hypothetical protein
VISRTSHYGILDKGSVKKKEAGPSEHGQQMERALVDLNNAFKLAYELLKYLHCIPKNKLAH